MNVRILKVLFYSTFVLFFLWFFGGCAKNKVHSTTKENPTDESADPDFKKVNFHGDLEDKLSISKLIQDKASGDLLKIQVELQNLSDKELNLSYKVEWLEDNGMIIKDASLVWMPLLVRGGELQGIQSVATSPKAKNFRLKIQRAKNP